MENIGFSEYSDHKDRDINFFSSLLVDEIENENIDKVKWLLLQRKADPNFVLPDLGISPMHVLAGFDNECFSAEVIEIALELRGGDPNIRSVDGLTPVHLAAIWGRCTVLEILLKFGGDPFLLEYKFSLNAEDLALREHQWQTHAILATFSVFNDKHEQFDAYLRDNSSLSKPSSENAQSLGFLREMTVPFNNEVVDRGQDKEYLPDREDKSEQQKKYMNQTPQSKLIPVTSFEETSNFCSDTLYNSENTKECKIPRRKKLSDQFAESITKFKNFFGRASFSRISSGNSPKVDLKRKANKTFI